MADVARSKVVRGMIVLLVCASTPEFRSSFTHCTISSAVDITPPAPAIRSAVCSGVKNGILCRDRVQDWLNPPLSKARFG
ncbi:hypothetical protein B0H14DRAFT_2667565 [Mycena olivaceomarginata]|nr:hypothetical protein B0H14DRAFT_2667565 [Mycena olivaceomarginata]